MSLDEHDTDTIYAAASEGARASDTPPRDARGSVRTPARALLVRAGLAVFAALVLAGSAVLLGLTIYSQTRVQKTPEVKYAPPIAIPPPAAKQPEAGGGEAAGPAAAAVPPWYGAGGSIQPGGSGAAAPAYAPSALVPAQGAPGSHTTRSFVTGPSGTTIAPPPPTVPARPPRQRPLSESVPPVGAPAAATAGPAYGSAGLRPRSQRTEPADGSGRAGEIRRLADKTFRRDADGAWVDVAYAPDASLPAVDVVAGSPEYATLLEEHPELGPYFRLSDHISVVLGGTVYRVAPGK